MFVCATLTRVRRAAPRQAAKYMEQVAKLPAFEILAPTPASSSGGSGADDGASTALVPFNGSGPRAVAVVPAKAPPRLRAPYGSRKQAATPPRTSQGGASGADGRTAISTQPDRGRSSTRQEEVAPRGRSPRTRTSAEIAADAGAALAAAAAQQGAGPQAPAPRNTRGRKRPMIAEKEDPVPLGGGTGMQDVDEEDEATDVGSVENTPEPRQVRTQAYHWRR